MLKLKPGVRFCDWMRVSCNCCPLAACTMLVVVTRSAVLSSRLRVNSVGSWNPSSTPNSSVLSSCTSTSRAWMTTCGGRASRFSTIAVTWLKYSGEALTISELLLSSAVTRTSCRRRSMLLTRPSALSCSSDCCSRKSSRALATSLARTFCRGSTSVSRSRDSVASSRSRIASTTARVSGLPTARIVFVRRSAENTTGIRLLAASSAPAMTTPSWSS